jgi:hypothetical protein
MHWPAPSYAGNSNTLRRAHPSLLVGCFRNFQHQGLLFTVLTLTSCVEGFLCTKQTEFIKLLINFVASRFTTQAYRAGNLSG